MASPEPTSSEIRDAAERPNEALLHLRRSALLSRIDGLASSPDRAELSRRLAQLRAELGQAGLRAGPGEEAATFSAEHFGDDLAQIEAAQSIERARYYIGRLRRAASGARTSPINEIDLNRWKEYDDLLTDSLWLIDRRDSSGVHNAGYWGNFIPQIPNQLMRRYTRRGDWVIDPFVGSGTTMIEGQRLGRNTLGVDLQQRMVERARAAVSGEPNRYAVQSRAVLGDSTTTDFVALLGEHGARAAQLVLMHPPYHDIIHFSDDPRDLSNAASVEAFLELIGEVVDNVAPALERGRYLGLVIGDKYSQSEWVPLGFLAMQVVQARGFTLKSVVVKNIDGTAGKRTQKELWRYRALVGGFYVFKHEYLFLFRKR